MLLEYFKPAREKYKKYMADYSLVQRELDAGNKKANQLHSQKYQALKEIV